MLTHYQGQPSSLEKKRKKKNFCVHKLSRIGQYRIFRVLNFREFGQNSQNSRKFLLAKVSAPKTYQTCDTLAAWAKAIPMPKYYLTNLLLLLLLLTFQVPRHKLNNLHTLVHEIFA